MTTFEQRAQAAAEFLEAIAEDRSCLADLKPELRIRVLKAAGLASRPDRADRKKLVKEARRRRRTERRTRTNTLLDQTAIRKLRSNPLFQTPRKAGAVPEMPLIGHTEVSRTCYICRRSFTEVHFFYDQLCPSCGDFNYKKRQPTANLKGRVALLTGARVKIGFQAAVMLLRSGCKVIITTRFPTDAARRYSELPDFHQYQDQIQIIGIDLRRVDAVEEMCKQLLTTLPRLDFIINNACQTVRRPPGYYAHLVQKEGRALTDRATSALILSQHGPCSATSTQVPLLPEDLTSAQFFPLGHLDQDEQQIDLREHNSWRMRLHEISVVELLEVQLVNAVAPFIINSRLKPLMERVPTADKHIVNVSAMEGQFYRVCKSDKHPHTNMAKAALNMMTRTASLDYINSGIHMNAVDTGWVTDEDPAQLAAFKREFHHFHPPLDIVDGAARIVDPIFHGINTGEHTYGQFLKDYRPTDW